MTANIEKRGRIARAVVAVVLLALGFLLWSVSAAAAIVLGLAAIFCLFEASQSWCAARACGIKTPL